ncbi:MAG: hypothetical protein ABR573_03030 [Candidatus Dormibacteria bacterium]
MDNPQLRRLREPAIAIFATLVVVGIAFVVPSAQAHGGSTPLSIIFSGVVGGLLTALTAAGLVLVYRSIRIINFAQSAIGLFGAVLCFNLLYLVPGIPFPVAFIAGLLGGAVLGITFHVLFGLRFARAPRLVLTLATVFVAGFFSNFGAGLAQGIPGLPDVATRTSEVISGSLEIRPFLPFPKFRFTVGSFPLKYGFGQAFALVMAVLILGSLAYFLAATRTGKAIRATAENTERAALLGISVGWLSVLVWAIAGALSSSSLMLTGFLNTPGSVYQPAPEFLLAPIAAAVLGRMRSLFTATLASIAYGVLYAAVSFQHGSWLPYLDVALFLALSAGLFFGGRQLTRGSEGSSWQATREVRPVPREIGRLLGVRAVKWFAIAAGVVLIFSYPFFVGVGDLTLGAVLMLGGIVVVSLVILVGWAGQASAGQFALVAIGAVVAALLNKRLGLGFYLVVPLAALLTAVLAAILAFPALRVQGLFLLASTFAFATMVRSVLFSEQLAPMIATGPLTRPTLFLVDFDDERSMYYLCVVALILAVVVVLNLRKSRFGRILIGVRDNEANARSAGVSAVRTRVGAFALAGGLAGFAGAIFVFQQRQLIAGSYDVSQSLYFLETTIVGGAASIGGALAGLALLNGESRIVGGIPGANAVLGLVPILVLYFAPGGVVAIFQSVRDGIFRIVAERRQLIVPSLFADIDPQSLHLRLVPLAEPLSTGGLQTLRSRFHLPDSMFAPGRRSRVVAPNGEGGLFAAAAGETQEASSAAGRTA